MSLERSSVGRWRIYYARGTVFEECLDLVEKMMCQPSDKDSVPSGNILLAQPLRDAHSDAVMEL